VKGFSKANSSYSDLAAVSQVRRYWPKNSSPFSEDQYVSTEVTIAPAMMAVRYDIEEKRITACGCLRAKPRGEGMANSQRDWKTRVVRGGFPDRTFDIEFWQEQGDESIFRAAWEMVLAAEEFKHGRKPRFQRTVTRVQREKS